MTLHCLRVSRGFVRAQLCLINFSVCAFVGAFEMVMMQRRSNDPRGCIAVARQGRLLVYTEYQVICLYDLKTGYDHSLVALNAWLPRDRERTTSIISLTVNAEGTTAFVVASDGYVSDIFVVDSLF
jgi:hypothetical protein